ncbi:MAG: S41 family peptidase [Anaerolineae bacterium]|nr:S41 family peptidase [Anaerolineae bacterium]MCI0608959.1 S41 family peptidase [Anaerolineae bacterium]
MKRKTIFPSLILIFSIALSACIGLLPLDEKPSAGDYGPPHSPQEHQARVFESLWTHLQDNYIYYESADVDWDALNKKYLEQINSGLSNEQFTALIQELEAELPSGTLTYQSRAERIEAETSDLSTYDGIGAFIGFSEDPIPHIILLSVIKGSPAEEAGLKAHDSIFKIDGNPVQLEEGVNAVNRIRGPAGSSVTLDVQSPGKPERSIELQRAKLTSTGTLESGLVPGTNYGYLLLPPIGYDKLMEDVQKSLQSFTTNRTLEGLILDLRIAGSARGWPLEELFTLFHDGKVGEFYNSGNQKQVININGKDQFSSQSVPLVILVGQNTTGSPEIFAASLQAGGRAELVGANTPGAIESTASFYLPNGSRVFIESASFRLPNGEEIGNSGVRPNVQIEAGWDEVLPNADPVLDAALELLSTP